MSDEDSDPLEADEEEILVYVEFEGLAGTNTFCNEKLQLDMMGLDMEHPMMHVNGKYYEGIYEDTVGTYLLFDNDNNPRTDDTVFDIIPTLKYFNKTRKILKMKRVFVKPRLEVLGDSTHPDCIPNIDTIREAGVPPQYQEETRKLWEQMRSDRLKALNEYLEKQRLRMERRQQGIEPNSETDEDDDHPFAMYKNDVKDNEEDNDSSNNNNKRNSTNDTNGKKCDHAKKIPEIIDPGPSTSKAHDCSVIPSTSSDQQEWEDLDDESEATDQFSQPIRVRNQGYIEVMPRRGLRKYEKKLRHKIFGKGNKLITGAIDSEKSPGCNNTTDEDSNTKMRISMDIDECASVSDIIEKVARDEITPENSDVESSAVDDPSDADVKMSANQDQVSRLIQNMNICVDSDKLEGDKEKESTDDDFCDEKKLEKQRKREAKMKEISERLKKSAQEIIRSKSID